MVAQGNQVSGGAGVGLKAFVKESRNSSDWKLKSVHSSRTAPNGQPVEQSHTLNEGQDNGGSQSKTPPIENQRDRKRTPSV